MAVNTATRMRLSARIHWQDGNQVYNLENSVDIGDDACRILPQPGTERLAAQGHGTAAIDGE